MITGILPEADKLLIDPAVPREVTVKHIPMEAPSSCLYIGKRKKSITKYLAFFDGCACVSNYSEAINQLLDSCKQGVKPDFIIVDTPFNAREFSNFTHWIRSNKCSFMIPVIYNETVLNDSELKKLNKLNVADDIVNIETYFRQLSAKAGLFRKSKLRSENHVCENLTELREKTPVSKRIFDILVAATLIVAGLPLFVIIALIIKIESRGPVIYKSKRAGRGFKVFNFYKFRTMIQDADKIIDEYADMNVYDHERSKSRFIKIKNDPRVTRFGRLLRNTSLDELPQLFNVLKGDMSIVGNRPLPLYEAATLTTNDDSERFLAPAGITGLWQVSKRGREDMDAGERIGLDIEYSRRQGFLTDCRILIKTPFALLQKSDV